MDTLTCYLTPQSGEVLTLTAPLHPAAEALIMGQITDPSGPCAGALVLALQDPALTPAAWAISDEYGRVYLGPLPADTLYTIQVQKSGSCRSITLPTHEEAAR